MSLFDTIHRVEVETASWRELDPYGAPGAPEVVNSAFSTRLPTLQLAVDSTSLGDYKICPRYYYLRHVLGFVPGDEANVHLIFGSLMHSTLEHYDHCRARGMDYEESVRSAIRFAILSTWDFDSKKPWVSGDPYKNRESLIRAGVWYLDHYASDPAETVILENGKPAVELSFRFEIEVETLTTHEPYILCGHFDKRVKFGGRVFTKDRKTTKSTLGEGYFARYTPDNQMSFYDLASTIVFPDDESLPYGGLMIDAIQLLITGARFQRGIVTRTPRQRQEFFTNTISWLRRMEESAVNEDWPMNDKACMMFSGWNSDLEHWHGGCPYRGICGEDPSVRENILQSAFVKKQWNPLIPR
jgi:hypothetical protein